MSPVYLKILTLCCFLSLRNLTGQSLKAAQLVDIELSPVSALRMTIAEVYGGMGKGGRVECVGLHVVEGRDLMLG